MGRKSGARELHVWMNGELVGSWSITSRGEHQLTYAESWLESPRARPLSLSMPLRSTDAPYRREVVESYFDNLLPENDAIRRRMMARFGASTSRPFDLLAEVGRDCIGAVQLLPPGERPGELKGIRGEGLKESEVESLLAEVATTGVSAWDTGDFRLSLAGAQEKTALLRHNGRWLLPRGTTPTTHILKLPMGDASALGVDFSMSVENEWLCAQLLSALGISVASCEIARFGEQKVLVVERFDRRLAEGGKWIVRLPQEDFCQATGTPPELKYERDGGPGIEKLMQLLRGSARALEDREELFRTLFVYWLLCAIDGHAKNFSLFIEAGGSYRLTPRYDVLSAYPVLGHGSGRLPEQKVKMAMALLGKNRHYRWREIRMEHWRETGQRCGLVQRGNAILEDILSRMPEAVAAVARTLPRDFPPSVSEPIFEGIRKAVKSALKQ